MSYYRELDESIRHCRHWLAQRKEQGYALTDEMTSLQKAVDDMTKHLAALPIPPELARDEPDDFSAIQTLRPKGPRRMALNLTNTQLLDKLHGAWMGRAAGCILGIPCEGLSRSDIRNVCQSYQIPYPLQDYWQVTPKGAKGLLSKHYGRTLRRYFLKPSLRFIGADDDMTYTILGLLILEEYGPEFTSEDVGEAWLKYLPMACTAEAIALENLKTGMKPPETAMVNNPYTDWIGADIRSDPWGYAAPGWPEKAAEFAWRDARVSHRGAGIHAAMFFSAAISAAFVLDDPVEALKLGLTEIPAKCRTARAARAALRRCKNDGDWNKTINAIYEKYEGMDSAHALNNLEITVAGICYGHGDFGRTIALTVMGGLDTDCTGATAGSIMGAVLGHKCLPKKWVAPLGNRVQTYLNGKPNCKSDNIARRFLKAACTVREALKASTREKRRN
jgi:ADP-ribosylglycohydrolase